MDSDEAELNYYQLLGITPGATCQQIKSAYRAMVQHTHPDSNGGNGDPELFQRVQEVYTTLSNPHLRWRYDLMMDFKQPQTATDLYRATFERLFDRLFSSLKMEWWDNMVRVMREETD